MAAKNDLAEICSVALRRAPTAALLAELERRLAPDAPATAAPRPGRRSGRRARRRTARAPARKAASAAAPAATKAGAEADRALKVVTTCPPENHAFDIAGIVAGTARAPRGQISIAEARALLEQIRAHVAAHPEHRQRGRRDVAAAALAQFLGLKTGYVNRRLAKVPTAQRSAPAPAATSSRPATNGSTIAQPTMAQRMAGR